MLKNWYGCPLQHVATQSGFFVGSLGATFAGVARCCTIGTWNNLLSFGLMALRSWLSCGQILGMVVGMWVDMIASRVASVAHVLSTSATWWWAFLLAVVESFRVGGTRAGGARQYHWWGLLLLANSQVRVPRGTRGCSVLVSVPCLHLASKSHAA